MATPPATMEDEGPAVVPTERLAGQLELRYCADAIFRVNTTHM